MKLNQNYWPIDKDYKNVTWWGPVHKTLGFQPWFNPVRNEYDSDAYQDKCYNILDGVCGKRENKIVRVQKQEIIDRGISQLFYFPR